MPPYQVHVVVGARPNFMKAAPLMRELAGRSWCRPVLVHTGQHYDADMSDAFFRDLGLQRPDIHLGVGGGSHGEQTAAVLVAYERVLRERGADAVIVVGDVNSTLAAALAARKLGIRVAHLEAGLRSGDRDMPEEINRVATDAIADLLWTPSPDADANLRREGVPDSRIARVGNIMIDCYEMLRPAIADNRTPARLGLSPHGYGVVTLHRPANVDDPAQLSRVAESLVAAAGAAPLVFPVHPRTRKRLEEAELYPRLEAARGLRLTGPLGYLDFMALVSNARLVITDSGGVQEETTYLGIPCLTMRDSTERPITVTEGTNRLIRADQLGAAIADAMDAPRLGRKPPALWDGATAPRVADSLLRFLHDA